MQEKQRYLTLKKQMRQRVKRILNNIDEKQRAELVARGRQEDKDEVLKNFVQHSSTTYSLYQVMTR